VNPLLDLESLGDEPGTDAAGAYLDAAHGSLVYGFDLLQVRVPGPAGLVIRMTDVIAEAGTFTAYFTYF